MAIDGSLASGLSFLIASSSHLVIAPKKILASVGPSRTSSPGLMPSTLITGNDAAHDRRKLGKPGGREIVAGERRIGGAESDGAGLDLLDAAAGADRLVVETDTGLLLVRVGPLRIDRIGERRASP